MSLMGSVTPDIELNSKIAIEKHIKDRAFPGSKENQIPWAKKMKENVNGDAHTSIRGVHISMRKFQSGFLKKHIIFPGCILFPGSEYVRVEHFDPGK